MAEALSDDDKTDSIDSVEAKKALIVQYSFLFFPVFLL